MGIPPVAPAVRKTAFYPPFRPFSGGSARSSGCRSPTTRAEPETEKWRFRRVIVGEKQPISKGWHVVMDSGLALSRAPE
jgi:hypothetical protein